MHMTALGGGKEPIFVDLIKDGQTMLTEVLPMNDGRGEAKIDLPPEFFGTMQLLANQVTKGITVQKRRVLFIRPPNQIKIQTFLGKKQDRRGDRARVGFALKGQDGTPIPGALSLAAVDDAVFAVLDQVPEMELNYFAEPNLLPAFALYPWSSKTEKSAGKNQNQLENAVFSRLAGTIAYESNERRGIHRRMDDFPSNYSLAASTFSDNLPDFEEKKALALGLVHFFWVVLAFAIGVVLYAAMWVFLNRSAMVVIHVGILGVLFVLCTGVGGDLSDRLFTGMLKSPGPNTRAALLSRERASVFGAPNAIVVTGFIDDSKSMKPQAVSPPRVRDWFPETLLWRPELITDEQGRASLDLDLADSITTWRLTASAVTADGRLGASRSGIKVFQPFFVDINLPVALTRNDGVRVPVVLYNYLDKSQVVELQLEPFRRVPML